MPTAIIRLLILGPRIVVTHEDRIDASTLIAREQADRRADRDGKADRDEADPNRNARSINNSCEEIASELIRPENVARTRGDSLLREILC